MATLVVPWLHWWYHKTNSAIRITSIDQAVIMPLCDQAVIMPLCDQAVQQ